MRYVGFRDRILAELHRRPGGLTWKQLRDCLDLPYDRPCPEWVKRMEAEDGLLRAPGDGRAYLWRVK